MILKPIEQITKEDIESLVAAKVSERRTLDYKQDFHGKNDRSILHFPEVLVEDYNIDIGRLLHPVFDALLQSCGLEKSLNYDDAGSWKPHQAG